jgi:hypothetical protein
MFKKNYNSFLKSATLVFEIRTIFAPYHGVNKEWKDGCSERKVERERKRDRVRV